MLASNGGELSTADDDWQVFPEFDDSDRKKAARSASHIVYETARAREWPGFPPKGVAFAANGSGDLLAFLPRASDPGELAPEVYIWRHETGTCACIASTLSELRLAARPLIRAKIHTCREHRYYLTMNDVQQLGTTWQSSWEKIPGQSAKRLTLSSNGREITFAEVVDCWVGDEAFRTFFLAELRLTPFVGFFWELPPLQSETLEQPYEHVVIEGNLLERISPDPAPFMNVLQASAASDSVVSFPNIGGDAILVVPKPQVGNVGYGHLGAFLRTAPEKQQHALLQELGRAAGACLKQPGGCLWISTAGLGVPWLHVRLDSRPKYYEHQPYRVP